MDDALHPNLVRTQETWDAIAGGELAGLDDWTDTIVVENGPGAGPWRVVEGKDAFLNFAMQFIPFFEGTWHQDGHCLYADDRCTISLVHETGTGPEGDTSTTWRSGSAASTPTARTTAFGPWTSIRSTSLLFGTVTKPS